MCGEFSLTWNFLDVTVIPDNENSINTDVFTKQQILTNILRTIASHTI